MGEDFEVGQVGQVGISETREKGGIVMRIKVGRESYRISGVHAYLLV